MADRDRRLLARVMQEEMDDIRWAQRRAVDALRFHGMESPVYVRARNHVNRLLEPGKALDTLEMSA